jgi:GMP synthase (glutamine-hydrolysing)
MRVHLVVHEAYEAPAAIATWAADRGHLTSYSRVYTGDRVPCTADGIDFLVIMGGPQSTGTTLRECAYFDSAAEQALISDAVAAGRAVVGVCLGAQLLGAALGAPAGRSEHAEIGVFPIRLTADGRADPRLAGFPVTLDAGHWHHDMAGLTPDAVVLAASDGCARQIIRYGELAYGFQCHLEFTRESVPPLIAASAGELAQRSGERYVQTASFLREDPYDAMNGALVRFLDNLARDYLATPQSTAVRAPAGLSSGMTLAGGAG